MQHSRAPLALAEGNRPPLLPLEWACEVQPSLDGRWLVKGILPASGLALVHGHPGSGKSFLALDMAAHVATGRPWAGLPVEQSLVIYVAAEGHSGFRNRIIAWRKTHQVDHFPLALIPAAIDLHDNRADVQALADTIAKAETHCGFHAGLIVIDTLSKTLGAGKENTDDLVVYLANAQRIASQFDATVMIVHHRPKDTESQEPRGHSSLRGGVDAMIIVESATPKRAKVQKQKDGSDGATVSFQLVEVEIGEDASGDPVTSCIVEVVQAGSPVPTDKRAIEFSRLNDRTRLIHRLIGDAIKAHGEPIPNSIPDTAINRNTIGRVVTFEHVSDICIPTLRTSSDAKPDSLRKALERALDKLKSKGFCGSWEEFLWLE